MTAGTRMRTAAFAALLALTPPVDGGFVCYSGV